MEASDDDTEGTKPATKLLKKKSTMGMGGRGSSMRMIMSGHSSTGNVFGTEKSQYSANGDSYDAKVVVERESE